MSSTSTTENNSMSVNSEMSVQIEEDDFIEGDLENDFIDDDLEEETATSYTKGNYFKFILNNSI